MWRSQRSKVPPLGGTIPRVITFSGRSSLLSLGYHNPRVQLPSQLDLGFVFVFVGIFRLYYHWEYTHIDCTWIFMSKSGRNIGLCKRKEQIGVALDNWEKPSHCSCCGSSSSTKLADYIVVAVVSFWRNVCLFMIDTCH